MDYCSLLFLFLEFGIKELILHHFLIFEALNLLMLVDLLPELNLSIEVVSKLIQHQSTDALLVERILGSTLELAYFL